MSDGKKQDDVKLEQCNEIGPHRVVLVRNVQTDNSSISEMGPQASPKLNAVKFFP